MSPSRHEPTPNRRDANRRLGWTLAVLAVAIFLLTLWLRS